MWRVIGAKVVGTSHSKVGRGCEDSFEFAIHRDNTLVIAVADGAGSAPCARVGADLSVRTAVASAHRQLLEAKPGQSMEALAVAVLVDVIDALGDRARTKSSPINDYACTLLACVLRPTGGVIVHVGDGAAVLQDDDGEIQVVSGPEHGEYLNETVFVTSPDAFARAKITLIPGALMSVALMTDGLERLAFDLTNWQAHRPFFAPLFEFVASPDADVRRLHRFLSSERVNQATDDDKTIVLASFQ